MSLTKLFAKAKVIATALPTWLAVVVLAAPIVAEEAASVLPSGWAERVTSVALTVVAVATAAINVIRRLTPVHPYERGILPKDV